VVLVLNFREKNGRSLTTILCLDWVVDGAVVSVALVSDGINVKLLLLL